MKIPMKNFSLVLSDDYNNRIFQIKILNYNSDDIISIDKYQ